MRNAAPAPDSLMTYRGPKLAPRREVPVHDAWRRLVAPQQRKAMLESVFSSERMRAGQVFAVVGAPNAGKSAVALAVADLRGYAASFATVQSEQPSFKPRPEMCVIIDPVSAYPADMVAACVKTFAGTCPVILVDRDEAAVRPHVGDGNVIRLKLPSPAVIASYMSSLLEGYRHSLEPTEFAQWAESMQGMSLTQVNAITVDAALLRLQHDEPVDSAALGEALGAYRRLTEPAGEAR